MVQNPEKCGQNKQMERGPTKNLFAGEAGNIVQCCLDNIKIYLKETEREWVKMTVISVVAVLNVLITLSYYLMCGVFQVARVSRSWPLRTS